jgi:hypothetical protein
MRRAAQLVRVHLPGCLLHTGCVAVYTVANRCWRGIAYEMNRHVQQRGKTVLSLPTDAPLFPHIPMPTESQRLHIRRQIRRCLQEAFPHPDIYHGPQHHEQVLRFARFTARHVAVALSPLDDTLLETAVLLHDIGYSAYTAAWSPNRHEHVQASIDIAIPCLASIGWFAQFPELIDAVSFLIAKHDDTSYKFPSAVWQGDVGKIGLRKYAAQVAAFEGALPAGERLRLHLLLAIIREADALSAAGKDGAERTYRYSRSRGLPLFAQGNPLNAWCWEESAVGNTRLAAKRALIDAFTPPGHLRAQESYAATEAYIAALCQAHAVPYIPESLAHSENAEMADELLHVDEIELIHYDRWESVEQGLRADASRPLYSEAAITIEPLPLPRLQSLAAPAPSHAEWLQALHLRLNREYALSLFDLAGAIQLRWRGELYALMPPLLEYHADHAITVIDAFGRATLAHMHPQLAIWAIRIMPPGATLPEATKEV